jgi:hypothetical protein
VKAGVDVDASRPPITLERDLLAEYRAGHPLAKVFPLIYDVLGRAAARMAEAELARNAAVAAARYAEHPPGPARGARA